MDSRADGPELEVSARAVGPTEERGRWLVDWSVFNVGGDPAVLHEVWLPHGRFRAERRTLDPPLELAPRAQGQIETVVSCVGEPDEEVENTFVILGVESRAEAWQVLSRFTVGFAPDGSPVPRRERVSTQRVGFAREQA